MPLREGPPQPAPPSRYEAAPRTYTDEQARGSEIILRTSIRRPIFIGGLVAMIVLLVLLRFIS